MLHIAIFVINFELVCILFLKLEVFLILNDGFDLSLREEVEFENVKDIMET